VVQRSRSERAEILICNFLFRLLELPLALVKIVLRFFQDPSRPNKLSSKDGQTQGNHDNRRPGQDNHRHADQQHGKSNDRDDHPTQPANIRQPLQAEEFRQPIGQVLEDLFSHRKQYECDTSRCELSNRSSSKSLRYCLVTLITLGYGLPEFAAAPADFWVYDVCPNTLILR